MPLAHVVGLDSAGPRYEAGLSTKLRPVTRNSCNGPDPPRPTRTRPRTRLHHHTQTPRRNCPTTQRRARARATRYATADRQNGHSSWEGSNRARQREQLRGDAGQTRLVNRGKAEAPHVTSNTSPSLPRSTRCPTERRHPLHRSAAAHHAAPARTRPEARGQTQREREAGSRSIPAAHTHTHLFLRTSTAPSAALHPGVFA